MVKLLFDHNMPPALARAVHPIIEIEGHEAYALREKFRPDIDDITLFKALSGEWVVISKDRMQSRKPAERTALLSSNVLGIYLARSVQKQRLNEQAATILWHMDKIIAQRRLNTSGLFLLPQNKGSKFKPV
ncbi:hypothetical protein [Jannaschia formosa]|uniref:PIN-like domain-containing protein n=1 Tax=Jannaschia formosa TaxID=2259592 RepID=UPI001074FBAA|nr:hypothetical protein [Jannaschia formosa]TFL18873.1 hypothetical protein DR046_08110 [Jannaschia formosa]